MTSPPTPTRFPRAALWVRYAFKAEQSLGSLPWVMLASVVGAVVAAAVAAGLVPHEAVRNGQVIDGSYLHVAWVAALGAFADVVLVILLAILCNGIANVGPSLPFAFTAECTGGVR